MVWRSSVETSWSMWWYQEVETLGNDDVIKAGPPTHLVNKIHALIKEASCIWSFYPSKSYQWGHSVPPVVDTASKTSSGKQRLNLHLARKLSPQRSWKPQTLEFWEFCSFLYNIPKLWCFESLTPKKKTCNSSLHQQAHDLARVESVV